MTTIFASDALLPHGWAENIRISLDGAAIAAVEHGAPPQAGDERHAIIIPAISNLHCHAFQRAMAGLAERRGDSADTFWTWRETMYRFALTMTPEDVEAVASQLYVEMLEAGFCRVGEFHYLHHDRGGHPFANIAEMAERIVAAASATGISLTLLPVFYAHSTFGGGAPSDGQRRFINDAGQFARLLEASRRAASGLDGSIVGVAPHSLRAVTPEELAVVTAMADGCPIHIHVAEQVKEVEDCRAWSGARPVEWLLGNAHVDGRWCLIHATHMTDDETDSLAASGAAAGLCPITEANLGDGVFPARRFLDAGGRFGVGSDSNILIGVADELRQLEYAQRLAHRQRNVLGLPSGSTGRRLFDKALAGGAAALGAGPAGIAAGNSADIVSLDADHPTLAGRKGDAILDAWIFAHGAKIDCVWARGHKLVEGGRHVAREKVAQAYRAAMRGLVGN